MIKTRGCRSNTCTLIGLLCLVASCAPQEKHGLSSKGTYIIGGTAVAANTYMSVVSIRDLQAKLLCTGTLVAPDWVATAGHCTGTSDPDAYEIGFGTNAYSPDFTREADLIRQHEKYGLLPNGLPINDIGLIHLSDPAPETITPVAWLPADKGISQDDTGLNLTFVGYGKVTLDGGIGDKTVATNLVDLICDGSESCIEDVTKAAPNTMCTDFDPAGPCVGDSGGPAVILRDGKPYLAGITSYGDQNCANFGCSTLVDRFSDFLGSNVGGDQGTPCNQGDTCDSGQCVNGVCCDKPCDGLCESCNLEGSVGICTPLADGSECEDSDPCDGQNVCQSGQCVPSAALPDCDDANPCTQDSCEPGLGCVHLFLADGNSCSDDDLCNGEEICIQGECQATDVPVCDDGNACNGVETCADGICETGDPLDCDDGDPCTQDGCDEKLGCVHEPAPHGYPCGHCGMCIEGACEEVPDCEEIQGSGPGCHTQGSTNAPFFLLWLSGLLILLRRK